MHVRGLVAVITGGASGLGRGAAEVLAAAGANVAILDQEAVPTSDSQEPGSSNVTCDVSDEHQVEAAFETIVAEHGVPRILVNCAGVLGNGALTSSRGPISLDHFEKVISTNLTGTFNCLRVFAAHAAQAELLPGGERGVIVNTASVAAWDGLSGQSAYSASKGAVAAMTLPLARELGPLGIRVLSVAPGMFETAMLGGIPDATLERLLADVTFPPRPGTPTEFGEFVQRLIETAMLNGEVVRLDGGLRMRDPPRAGRDA